jgi:hypothetical protein
LKSLFVLEISTMAAVEDDRSYATEYDEDDGYDTSTIGSRTHNTSSTATKSLVGNVVHEISDIIHDLIVDLGEVQVQREVEAEIQAQNEALDEHDYGDVREISFETQDEMIRPKHEDGVVDAHTSDYCITLDEEDAPVRSSDSVVHVVGEFPGDEAPSDVNKSCATSDESGVVVLFSTNHSMTTTSSESEVSLPVNPNAVVSLGGGELVSFSADNTNISDQVEISLTNFPLHAATETPSACVDPPSTIHEKIAPSPSPHDSPADEWEQMALAFPTAATTPDKEPSSAAVVPVLLRPIGKQPSQKVTLQPWRTSDTAASPPESDTSDTESGQSLSASPQAQKPSCAKTQEPRIRQRVFAFAFILNVAALVLTLVASLATSEKYNVLEATAFAVGTVTTESFQADGPALQETTFKIGLRAVGIQFGTTLASSVVSHEKWCEMVGDHVDLIHHTHNCTACADVGSQLSAVIILALLFLVPSVLSNLARMQPQRDSGFQRIFGTCMAGCGCILRYVNESERSWSLVCSSADTFRSLYACAKFTNSCYASLYDGEALADKNLSAQTGMTAEQAAFAIIFDWRKGPGLVCLIVATVLRGIELAVNAVMPIPTRERWEQLDSQPEPLRKSSVDVPCGSDTAVTSRLEI